MSTEDFQGKTAIVTGATRGIGYAIANALAMRGATVAFNHHSRGDLADELIDAERPLERQDHAVDPAPHDPVPARPVPQAAEEHRGHQGEVGARGPVSAAAERDEEVIAQETRQADVPAPPESSYAVGLVRREKINRQT